MSTEKFLKEYIQECYPNENINDITNRELNAISDTLGFACYSLSRSFKELILSIADDLSNKLWR